MNTELIINHVSHKGGTNNLRVVSVISGFSQLAVFTGKTADRRAKAFQRTIK